MVKKKTVGRRGIAIHAAFIKEKTMLKTRTHAASTKFNWGATYALAILGFIYSSSSSAIIIDFETTPLLATGPSLFESAGPSQTISVGGVSISGGVVLGLPTNLPATPYSTAPNLYGTANHPSGSAVGDASLLPTISIDIDTSLGVTMVEGLLFNGLIESDDFLIEAFSSAFLVDSVTLSLAANLSSGFDTFQLNSGGAIIDRVTIAADLSGPLSGEWDYFIDTLAVGEPIENVREVPEPAPLSVFCISVAALLFMPRIRKSFA